MKHETITGSMAAAGLLLLILDAKTGLTGAGEGLNLCLYTVIPALFPFFILSSLLTSSLMGGNSRLMRILGRFCRIPEGSEILLVTGLLGGYPVGAKSVAQAWEGGWLSRKDAWRMLGFCSNAGPAFLFGMIAPVFGEMKFAWSLWAIHIMSALLTGHLIPGGCRERVTGLQQNAITVPEALERSVRITALVCGWVVLFRVILAFGDKWLFPIMPVWLKVPLSGVLELTNGCIQLQELADHRLRYILCSGILAFGGVCVWMQTASAVKDLGLGLYLPGKLLQTGLSLLMASILCAFLYPGEGSLRVAMPAIVILAAILIAGTFVRKKGVAIPGKMIYNGLIKIRRQNHAVPKEY